MQRPTQCRNTDYPRIRIRNRKVYHRRNAQDVVEGGRRGDTTGSGHHRRRN